MKTPMRFRTDSWYEPNPAARPGDLWRIRWHKEHADGNRLIGPIAGYAICCPDCGQVHHWTTATNCPSNKNGVCEHSGKGSCWEWSGSAEENRLSVRPSLQVTGEGGCRWHGHLVDGELIEA